MVAQAAARSAQGVYPAPSSRPRLLIVTDGSDRLRDWKASIDTGRSEVEITGAASIYELGRACQQEHDLAVIDVGAEALQDVLRILRASVRHSRISLLVEASRVIFEPGLAGLLPRYRAMACGRADLLKLARGLVAGKSPAKRYRRLL